MKKIDRENSGFTLIELSIVLVIIGLIIGGILTGQDLIDAARQRAQIAQIEKYNTAVNTFKGKYGELPGDMESKYASQFGFATRTGAAGRGDNNGELDGYANTSAYSFYFSGELLLFWSDLSAAGLIDGTFTNDVDGVNPSCTSISACNVYFPAAKIGNSSVVYVYSGYAPNGGAATNTGPNFFGLNVINILENGTVGTVGGGLSSMGLTVNQAYNIDKKADDGYPKTGNIRAQYAGGVSSTPGWANYNTGTNSLDCWGNISGVMAYYTSPNGGLVDCALSFQFQ